ALGAVELCDVRFRIKAEIVSQLVPVAVDFGLIVGQTAEQVEIRAIAVRRIVEPIAAAEMMIGIKTVGLIADSQAEADAMPWDCARQFVHRSRSVTARLETVPVAEAFKLR